MTMDTRARSISGGKRTLGSSPNIRIEVTKPRVQPTWEDLPEFVRDLPVFTTGVKIKD